MTVTMVSDGGLCNRMKNMISAMSQYDSINTISDIDSYIFPFLNKVDNIINPYPKNWRLEVFSEEEKYTKEYKTIDFLYEKVPQYFIDKYLSVIKKIQINSDIIQFVNQYTFDWEDVIGVHIRTWQGNERAQWHSNSLFENEIDKLNSNKKIFLCSDNSDTIGYFKSKYQDRIIIYDQTLHNTPASSWSDNANFNNLQLVVDGIIDNLLLSKCDIIIGTWVSTFSEVAWWLGGCKSKVIIPKPPNVSQNFVNSVFLKGVN